MPVVHICCRHISAASGRQQPPAASAQSQASAQRRSASCRKPIATVRYTCGRSHRSQLPARSQLHLRILQLSKWGCSRGATAMAAPIAAGSGMQDSVAPDFEQVLFVEAGSGADQHGQNATKAAVRACRNAIEFNSLPAIRKLVPNGYDGLKLRIKIGVPDPDSVDAQQVKAVFPYGSVHVEVVEGGLRASSGIAIAELGDRNDDWYIAVAAVTVGY